MKKVLSVIFAFTMLVTSFIVNPITNVMAEEVNEWTSNNAHIAKEVIEGVRYYELASTNINDNAAKAAEIVRTEKWNIEGKEGNASIEFTPISNKTDTRFGINILHTDMNNYITAGFDASGWFWEYKIDGSGEWMTGDRVPAPETGSLNKFEVELKDNKLIAFNTIEDGEKVKLFEHQFEVNILDQLSEKSQDRDNVVLRLASHGDTTTTIHVKADDQSGLENPDENARPEIGKYDEYSYDLDFEGLTEEDLENILSVNDDAIKLSLVDHNDSQALQIDFTNTRGIVTFDKIPLLDNYEIEVDMTPLQDVKRLGLVGRRNAGEMVYAAVGEAKNSYFSEHYGNSNAWSQNSTGPDIEANETKRWTSKLFDSEISLAVGEENILKNDMGGMTQQAGELGIFKDRGAASVIIDNVSIKRIPPIRPESPSEEGTDIKEIKTDQMTVRVDADFPRVIDYTMTDGSVMYGQASTLDTFIINGNEIKPTVTSEISAANKIEYTLNLNDEAANVNAIFKAEFVVENNILEFNITEIENLNGDQSTNDGIIRTIEIPNHSLVSVRSDDANAAVMGAKMSTNTVQSGDTLTKVDDNLTRFNQAYMYAFVSDSNLSAGLASNSQTSVKGDFNRVNAQATEYEGFNAVGLGSSQFIYNRDVKFPEYTLDLPKVKVAITGDANNDDKVDWQDGAVAFRDIMYLPQGAEDVKDLVAYRIAMNFGSHAQNPFLMTLDNIKKVNLHTGGLGQSILLKGYGSEGHDSGHLNYADIGRRMGGAEEFIDLLDQSVDYGALIGIHVNASETYPESKYFTEDLLRKNADGSYNYGWNWIDQGINIDAEFDLANGRLARWEDLKEVVGENLDWIYVDVWGNGQSGDNGSWTSHQLAKEIFEQGWRLGGEWGYAFEGDSTFQHWAADLTYGGYGLKGINSNVTRFIFNGYRDSWNAHYPSYSGSADYPLLGGYNMQDFEGWQGRNDYDGYMTNLFENNLSTKFIQHFDATRWVEGNAVSMPNPAGGKTMWTPEMLIELEGDLGKLVIERKSNDWENDKENYRSRTITLNDRLVLDGDTYLIPWNWDAKGETLDAESEKLYHFNKAGGTSTWSIPSDWGVSNVEMYQLTETGNKSIGTIPVVNGEITLEAEANKAYAVYKGEQAPVKVTYGRGAHIVDPHFNTQNFDVWDVVGDGAEVMKSQASNDMLRILDNKKETKVSQVLTDLTPGKDYVAYVGVDNRSDAAAKLTIDFEGFETSEYTNKSIAKNWVKAYGHNTNSSTIEGNSYFQNMFVYFTAPAEGTDVTLTLSRDAGAGATYFDDVRVTENKGNPHIKDGVYFQDFEEAAQGIAPFVVGNIENVEDNRTHLSEKNDPYTQRGWNDKKISDVIEGDWSLKTNGLTQRDRLVYQTIPQNVRFEPGKTYKVSFDYEAGSEGTYAIVIGDGEVTGDEIKTPLAATLNEAQYQNFEVEITGADSGQTWLGIWSTTTAPNLGDSQDKDANFRSYKDIMLDNIRVEEIKEAGEDVDTSKLISALTLAKEKNEKDYTEETFIVLSEAITSAEKVLADTEATQDEVDAEVKALEAAIDGLKEFVLYTDDLDMAMNLAESKVEDDHTADTWTTFIKVYNKVKSNYDTFETQEEVDAAKDALETAIEQLKFKDVEIPVETSDLETLIAELKDTDLTGKTVESADNFKAALKASQDLLDSEDKTQAQVDTQIIALQAAYDALDDVVTPETPVKTEALEALIEKFKDTDLTGKTVESADNFKAALKASQDLLDSEDKTQAQVDAQEIALQAAYDELDDVVTPEPTVDTTELQALILELKDTDLKGKTKKSSDNFKAALKASQDLVKSEDKTQDQVDAQLIALQKAFDELENTVVVKPTPEKPGKPTPETPEGPKDDLPATGMAPSFALPGIGISTALAGVYLVLKKKNEK